MNLLIFSLLPLLHRAFKINGKNLICVCCSFAFYTRFFPLSLNAISNNGRRLTISIFIYIINFLHCFCCVVVIICSIFIITSAWFKYPFCLYIYIYIYYMWYKACSRIRWESFLLICNKTIIYQVYIRNYWYYLQ